MAVLRFIAAHYILLIQLLCILPSSFWTLLLFLRGLSGLCFHPSSAQVSGMHAHRGWF